MNSPEQDKAFYEAGLQQLETYTLSRDLYWPSSVHSTDFSQMTLGAMLLVRERLKGWKIPGLQEPSMQMDAIRLKWRSAWDAKASREIHARIELWRDYLDEARHAPDEFARRYPYQARLRAILSLLLEDLRESSPDLLTMLDGELRRIFKSGSFVWDQSIAWVFPRESFWFLFGAPVAQEK